MVKGITYPANHKGNTTLHSACCHFKRALCIMQMIKTIRPFILQIVMVKGPYIFCRM